MLIYALCRQLSRVEFTHFLSWNPPECQDWGAGRGGQAKLGNARIFTAFVTATPPLFKKYLSKFKGAFACFWWVWTLVRIVWGTYAVKIEVQMVFSQISPEIKCPRACKALIFSPKLQQKMKAWQTLIWTFTFLVEIFAILSKLIHFSLLGGTSSILFWAGPVKKNTL